MTLVIIGKNERIDYLNVKKITDNGDVIELSNTENGFQILADFHCIGTAKYLEIKKRCLITNEVYLVVNENRTKDQFFTEVEEDPEDLPFQ